MHRPPAHISSTPGGVARAARQPFLRSITSLGRCVNTAKTTLPLLVEEASWYAEQQLKWTGLALAGELASEGLWAYQVRKQQEDRERGRQVSMLNRSFLSPQRCR
jgi:hypothetical protein